MPRISRSTVRFQVDGYDYEARFFHYHREQGGLMTMSGVATTVRHVTDCYLRLLGSVDVKVGTACCSFKDIYEWKTGIKLSFTRALNQLLAPVNDHELYRQLWGKFMYAFYTESRVRVKNTPDMRQLYKNPDCNIEHLGQSCNVACGY